MRTNISISTQCRFIAFLGFLFLLGACSTPYTSSSYVNKNNEIFNNQLVEVMKNAESGNTVYFFGFALWGEESWSENDIKEIKNVFTEFYPDKKFSSFIFSNKETTLPDDYPSIQEDLAHKSFDIVSNRISPNDIAVIAISSHGSENIISNKIGYSKAEGITAETIDKFISKLSSSNKIIVISACYSGSLIETIKDEKSIIFTAASKDRQSFGCGPGETNSWFVRAIKDSYEDLKVNDPTSAKSLGHVFSKSIEKVTEYERKEKKKPSNPQLFVGGDLDKSLVNY